MNAFFDFLAPVMHYVWHGVIPTFSIFVILLVFSYLLFYVVLSRRKGKDVLNKIVGGSFLTFAATLIISLIISFVIDSSESLSSREKRMKLKISLLEEQLRQFDFLEDSYNNTPKKNSSNDRLRATVFELEQALAECKTDCNKSK